MDSREVLVADQLASLSLRDDNVTVINSVSLHQTNDRANVSSAASSKLKVDHRLKEIEEADHEKNKIKNQTNNEIGSHLTAKSGAEFNKNNNNYDRNNESIDPFKEPVQTILIESVRRSDWSRSSEDQVPPVDRDGQTDPSSAEFHPPTGRGPVGGLAVAYQIPSDYGVSAHFGAGGKRHYDYSCSPEIAVDFTSSSHLDGGSTFEQPSKFYRPVPVESEDAYDDGTLLPELSPDLDDFMTQGELEEFLQGHQALDNFDDLLPILKMFAGDDVPNPAFISPGQPGAFKNHPMTSTSLSFPNLSPGTTKQHVPTAGNLLPEVSAPYGPTAAKNVSWDGVRLNGFVPKSIISDAPSTEFQSSNFNGTDIKPRLTPPRVPPPQGSPQVYANSGIVQGGPALNYGQMKVEVDADKRMTVLPSNPAVPPSRPCPIRAMNAGAGGRSAGPMAEPSLLPPYAVTRMPISTTAPAVVPVNARSPNAALDRLQYSAAQQRTEDPMNERRQLAKASSVIARLTREQLVVLDPDQDTLLHLAIAKNERYLTESLISRLDREKLTDSMINLKNKQGQSPLCLATVTNQPAIVRLLVERSVDVNAQIPLGAKQLSGVFCNPIHFASSNGKEWIQTLCELLNSNSLKLSALDSEGHTALHKAVSSHGQNLFCGKNCEKIDSRESIQQLIIRGIDINQPNGLSGKTALHMSLEKGNLDLFLDIINFASQRIPVSHIVNARTGLGADTLLHVVAKSFRTLDAMMLVQYMLGCGANAQLRNNDNRLPWEVALLPQVAEILKL